MSQASKVQEPKKETNKGKDKEKSKKGQKEKPKEKKELIPEEEYDFYTPEEIALLDKFHEFSNHKFIDEEIYDIMQKFNNDEELIKNELKERLKDFLKGDEFDWVEIGEKGKKVVDKSKKQKEKAKNKDNRNNQTDKYNDYNNNNYYYNKNNNGYYYNNNYYNKNNSYYPYKNNYYNYNNNYYNGYNNGYYYGKNYYNNNYYYNNGYYSYYNNNRRFKKRRAPAEAKEIDVFPEKKEQIAEEKPENIKEEEKDEVNNDKKEEKIEIEEVKEVKKDEPKKEIVEAKPVTNLRGKKTKKEPRKPEKEKEKEKEEIKPKEIKEASKKESVQELEKELEQETKEINTEVETELKKTSTNNTLELTTTHQENFGIDPTPSKQKAPKEKPQTNTTSSKTEFQSSKNYRQPETPNFNPYSMFPPMFTPMMMPNTDNKGGQTPMYYMVPVPVDSSQFPKDYWQNMSMYYPMMQNMYPPNFNKQNNNSKK